MTNATDSTSSNNMTSMGGNMSDSLMSIGNEFCPEFENCVLHQVTANFTNYGCSQCESDYLLNADKTGSGYCKEKNPIENCIASQVTLSNATNSTPICWRCEKDHVLDNNKCMKKKENETEIQNCFDYFRVNNTLYCNTCESGFTGSNDGKQCLPGCDIPNCETCSMIKGNKSCWKCKEGFIGVFGPAMYSACLTCDQWLNKLKVDQ